MNVRQFGKPRSLAFLARVRKLTARINLLNARTEELIRRREVLLDSKRMYSTSHIGERVMYECRYSGCYKKIWGNQSSMAGHCSGTHCTPHPCRPGSRRDRELKRLRKRAEHGSVP